MITLICMIDMANVVYILVAITLPSAPFSPCR